ncbi:MAG: hypothetical protein K2P58_07755 [Hyphomonadaceae bacterium]|nr:hypothetical protein [Hyphomonadaceae bacterium]
MQQPQRRSLYQYWGAAFALALLAATTAIAWRNTLATTEAAATTNDAAASATTAISSPFAPWTDAGSADNVAALLGGVRLIGVRVAPEPSRSGAIFLIAESDTERAFLVGEEIVPGLRVSAIAADHVLVATGNGQLHTLSLDGEMRAAPIEGASPPPGDARPGQDLPNARAWLTHTIARPEESIGPSPGWRVRPPLSEAAAAAGLQVGDLILTINGAPPSATNEAATAAQQDMIQLSVLRSDGARFTIWYSAN